MRKVVFGAVAIVAVATAVVLAVTLHSRRADRYDPRSVKLLGEGVNDKGVFIVFRAPENSPRHYCPGAMYEVSGTSIRYSLVRAASGDNVDVQAKAVLRDEAHTYRIDFPWDWSASRTVELVDSAGKRHGRHTLAKPVADETTWVGATSPNEESED